MALTEARLMQLRANAEENGTPQDIPHWQDLLDEVQHDARMSAR